MRRTGIDCVGMSPGSFQRASIYRGNLNRHLLGSTLGSTSGNPGSSDRVAGSTALPPGSSGSTPGNDGGLLVEPLNVPLPHHMNSESLDLVTSVESLFF